MPSLSLAAAKSLQSCPTLCDPIGGNPPGSADSGILQARTLEWVAIAFSETKSLKEINSQYSLEGLTLKFQYCSHLMQRANSLERALMLGKIDSRRAWQRTRWLDHQWLNGYEFDQAPGDGEGQGSLVWCSPLGLKSWTWLSDWTTTNEKPFRGIQQRKNPQNSPLSKILLSSEWKQTTRKWVK